MENIHTFYGYCFRFISFFRREYFINFLMSNEHEMFNMLIFYVCLSVCTCVLLVINCAF